MSVIAGQTPAQDTCQYADEEKRIGLGVKSKDVYDLTVTELSDLPRQLSNDSLTGESFENFISRQVSMITLPEINESKSTFTNLRYQIYTVYHRIFSVVFVANMIPFGIILADHRTAKALLTAAAVNLAVCGMARLPYVINTLYTITCLIPRSAPMFLRRRLAKISHYGGIHSGTGVASFCWYMAYVAVLTRDYVSLSAPFQPSIAVLVLSYLVLVLLAGMIIAAYPALRFVKHDTFEFVHRFSSWLLIVLFWSTYLKASHDTVEVTDEPLSSLLVKDPPFWLAIIITCSLISPWLTLRRVPVIPEHLSSHAVRLHLDYTKTKLSQGIAVSRHPLRDWHAFAAIPEQDGNGFSLVVSKAGDWTSHCIQSPPTKLWKRAIPTYGFGRVTSIFNRCIVIATGSGVGPSLSLLSHAERPPLRFIWQTRNPRKTYGQRILNEVNQLDPNAIVIDSDAHGRRDMLPLAYSLAREIGAEAVFVVSNPIVTRHLVYGLEARGIAAYGALFDS